MRFRAIGGTIGLAIGLLLAVQFPEAPRSGWIVVLGGLLVGVAASGVGWSRASLWTLMKETALYYGVFVLFHLTGNSLGILFEVLLGNVISLWNGGPLEWASTDSMERSQGNPAGPLLIILLALVWHHYGRLKRADAEAARSENDPGG